MTLNARLSTWNFLSVLFLILFGIFLVYPVINMLGTSLLTRQADGSFGWSIFWTQPQYSRALINTMTLGLSVACLTTLIGVPLAYVTARYHYIGKSIVALLPLITLVIPEVISAQTWLMILGNNGFITRFLLDMGVSPPSFYGWPGLLVVMSFNYYAYVYIGTLAAIKSFDVQLEEAAQSLGSSPLKARLHTMIPIILPAILGSGLLVFTLTVGNFATSLILGHQVELLSVLTYQAAVSETGTDPVIQSTLATTSIALVMIVLFIQKWVLSKGRYDIVQGRTATAIPAKGIKAIMLSVGSLVILTLSLLPVVTLFVGAFTQANGPVMQWGSWTFDHLWRVFSRAFDPIMNTLIYASLATGLGILISVFVSYLIVKKQNLITPILDYLGALPLALSGTVIGIGLLMSFKGPPLVLAGGLGIVVLAYIVRRISFGIRNISSALYNIPSSIEEASISLGVPPVQSFIKVILPILLPAIFAAMILTWTTTVAELSASVIVYSPGQETIPIQIFKLVNSGLLARASAYGVILIGLILLPVVIATRVFKLKLFT